MIMSSALYGQQFLPLEGIVNVRDLGGKDRQLAVVKTFLGANTDNFIKALDEIDVRYGSMDAYLKGPMGLTEEDILTLRERYLSPR